MMAAVIAMIFYSCSEAPRNFNSNLLGPDQISLISTDSYTAGFPQSSNSFKTVIATGNSGRLLLGNYKSSSGAQQEASILIKFDFSTIPDSIKNDLKNNNATVVDSWVIFSKNYAFGDTLQKSLNFAAYKINSPWTSAGFTSDSLNASFSYNSGEDLSSQKAFVNDSSQLYRFHLKAASVNGEIQNFANSVPDYGIYLKPTSSAINTVWGFGAIALNSVTQPALQIVVNKTGVYTDTLGFNALSNVSVLAGNLPTAAQDIILQPRLVAQARIWFDVSSLPSDAIINQARIILIPDSLNTVKGTNYNLNLLAFNIADSASRIVDSTFNPTTIIPSDSGTYEGVITAYVQKWVTAKINQGIIITPQDGLSGMEIFALKGSNASDAAKRPRLKILYTTKK